MFSGYRVQGIGFRERVQGLANKVIASGSGFTTPHQTGFTERNISHMVSAPWSTRRRLETFKYAVYVGTHTLEMVIDKFPISSFPRCRSLYLSYSATC